MNSNSKKVILTHGFHGNYGGMLQAYALRVSLARFCSEAWVEDFSGGVSHPSLMYATKKHIKKLQYALGAATGSGPVPYYFWKERSDSFKRLVSIGYFSARAAEGATGGEKSAWIVGSDQVWRAKYARSQKSVPFFFLDFLPEVVRRRSISYAASFGTDEWEGTPEETAVCRELLQQFKAVSVREHSGVMICREVFGVEAVQMSDPTLLAELADYQRVIDSEKTSQRKEPYIAAYVLDESEKALASLQAVAEQLALPVQHLMPHATAKHRRDRFPLSVPQWLRYIKECDLVVTDSFHGCIFAIIYNKPFVCLGNEGRGSARFDTLFQTLHLEFRLATSPEQAVAVAREPIDWAAVNAIHERERERGLAFLREHLT